MESTREQIKNIIKMENVCKERAGLSVVLVSTRRVALSAVICILFTCTFASSSSAEQKDDQKGNMVSFISEDLNSLSENERLETFSNRIDCWHK